MLKELKVSERWRVLGKMAVCHKKKIIISTSLGMKKERQKGKGSRVGGQEAVFRQRQEPRSSQAA